MLKKLLTLVMFCLVAVSYGYAQSGSIRGTVTDSQSGDPLPSTNIYIPQLQRGTATDINGNFVVENLPAGTYTLRVTYIGYSTITKQITVNNGEVVVNFAMKFSSSNLSELVVTGIGEVSKRNYTGSVVQISNESIQDVPVADVGQALQGKVAGASITSATGTPGAVQQIRIRGISSINAGTEPLYVIDGVPVVSGNNAASGATSSLGVLSNISPSDIASITVLKDAVSTAPYGARGANGVIVINTKQGHQGQVTYNLSVQSGVNSRAVDGPGALNAQQWSDLFNTSLVNGGYTEAQAESFNPWDGTTDTNWHDVVTDDKAAQEQYSLSAQGGNDQTTFYASGNYFKQEGQLEGSGLDRLSGKVNVSHHLDKTITIKNNFTGSYVKQNGILEGAGYFGSPVLAQYFLVPIDKAYNDEGAPNTNLYNSIFNPVYVRQNDISRKHDYRLLNNTTLDVNLTDNLTFSSNFAVDYILTEEKYYRNPYYGDGQADGGSVDDIDDRNFNYVWRNTLKYIWSANEDNLFTFRALSESQRNYFRYLEGYGTGIAAGGLYNLNTVATPQGVGSSTSDWAIQSFTGLVNYSYKDKLFLDGSIRYEGNTRFAEDQRWGTFYSIGLGYILTEENFFKNVSWLNFLKAKASYGLTGNASINLNQYQATVGFGSYNNTPSIYTSSLGNAALTWENQKDLDLGIEFKTFGGLNGSVTLFKKNGYDLLFNVPLSRTTGQTSQTQNLGKLYNEGIEVELNADIIHNDNFAWNVGGNFTALKNEVTDLPLDPNGNPRELTTSTRYQAVEGYSVNAWYMPEWAGVDPGNGDPLWYKNVLDGDGNPTGERTTTNNYNEADPYYQGANAQPTKYGGINTRIDVFGFYVSADLYYAFGNKIFDNWAYYMRSDGQFNTSYGQYGSQADYWTPDNENAKNPKPIYGGNNNSNQNSSRFLYKGDYLRLKTINIGYHIPVRFLSKTGLKDATVYFLGQNLWTHRFDKNLELDPEVNANGFKGLLAAPIKSLTFGINVNF